MQKRWALLLIQRRVPHHPKVVKQCYEAVCQIHWRAQPHEARSDDDRRSRLARKITSFCLCLHHFQHVCSGDFTPACSWRTV
jgi:hypothetical protein